MKKLGNFGRLHNAFARQPATMGNMHAPSSELHPDTMLPLQKFGSGMASGLSGKGTSVQSPAQHQAVEKAAQASAAKRKKGGILG